GDRGHALVDAVAGRRGPAGTHAHREPARQPRWRGRRARRPGRDPRPRGADAPRRRHRARRGGRLGAMSERVLISTHDLPLAGRLRSGFEREGYRVELVTPDEEIGHEKEAVLLVLTGTGGREGPGRLHEQARARRHLPVFAVASEEALPPALRPGFDEVFARSVPVEDIGLVGRSVIERRRLRRLTGIVGETDAMQQVLERVVQIAPVRSTVLVTGESGTGKELVARGIHLLSPRRHKPFI